MKMGMAVFLFFAPMPGFAGSWSGFLVDSTCYASEDRDVSPTDTMTYVDRDMDLMLRYCYPKAKTKNFGLVQEDWESLKFDSAGNAKAAELVHKIGKRKYLSVAVTGKLNKDTIQVDKISAAK
jgi:hypothetical protein